MVRDKQKFFYWNQLVRNKYLRLMILLLIPACLQSAQASVLGFVEYEGSRNDNTSPSYFTQEVVESPDGKYVYSISSVNERLNAFSRDAETGMLTMIQSVENTDDYGLRGAYGMAISPDGNYVYVSGITNDPFDNSISWFQRDGDTGMLTYAGRIVQDTDIPSGYDNPNGELRISADGFFLYAGDRGAVGQIIVFRRADNGVLTHVQTATSSGQDMRGLRKFALSSDGRHVYAVSYLGQALIVFNRDRTTGMLMASQVIRDIHKDAAEGIAGLETAEDVIVSADGRFVYTTGMIQNDTSTGVDDEYTVLSFSRDTNDGRLVYLTSTTNTSQYGTSSDWDTLRWPTSLAFSTDSEQKFLYVGAQIADAINVFRRNPDDGSLSWVGWETEGENGVTNLQHVQDIVVSRDGRHIYAALDQGDGISVFDTRADMSVVKTDSTDPVNTGDSFSYTLSVTNNGPSDAQNVILTDTLPAGIRFVRAIPNAPGASCSESGGTITCDLAGIAATTVVNTLVEVLAPMTAGSLSNSAAVMADQLDTEIANNTDTEETCVEETGSNACGGGGAGTAPPPVTGTPAATGGGGGSVGTLWILLLTGLLALGFRMPGKSGR